MELLVIFPRCYVVRLAAAHGSFHSALPFAGLDVEGVFRRSANVSVVKEYAEIFNQGMN